MPGAPFYLDPADPAWPKPNLIEGLIAAPTTEKVSPLERQATIVLAWLAHHSRTFAVALLERFLADDDEGLAALASRGVVIGARAWGTLRKIEGLTEGPIYPDITIAGSGQSFELIVEIKIDAALHWWPTPDGTRIYQPNAYIRSWLENYDQALEAGVRRVGTLTRSGHGLDLPVSPHRAADLHWKDVRELLRQLLEDGRIEPEVVAVALDAAAAIDQRILAVKGPPPIDDPVMAWSYVFLAELAPGMAECLPGGSIKLNPAVWSDYAGVYVYFETPFASDPQRIHLYATPAEGQYNVAGCGASLFVSETADYRWPARLRALMQSAGIPEVKDKAGYKSHRLRLDVADIQAAGDEQAQLAYVLEAAAPLLAALNSA
jgi:hypothetical protein